ncbi:8668_t:CDS:2 [Entrophospora sp. SA101]|nr:8668_t:CDS:2 [Entrophospora sp. SA101]
MNALDRIQKSLQEISEYRQEVIQASNRSSTYDQDNLIYCQNLEKIVFNELKVEEYANKNKGPPSLNFSTRSFGIEIGSPNSTTARERKLWA